MAIYQFIVVLLPKPWLSNDKNNVSALFNEDGYDVSDAWKTYQPTEELYSLLSEVLPRGKSWHTDLKVWGNQEYSDIQVWDEDGSVESISIRLDLREDTNSLLAKVVNLAIELNCVLFIPGSKGVLEPNVFELNEIMNNSNAAKYVNNPDDYLKGIKHE